MLVLWGALWGLVVTADTLLLVTPVERIHYLQYGILSILLSKAIRGGIRAFSFPPWQASWMRRFNMDFTHGIPSIWISMIFSSTF